MITKKIVFSLLAVLVAVSACTSAVVTTNTASTTLFVNAQVITVDDARPTAESLAVRDGKILAVGSRSEVESAAGSNVELRDMQGKTMLPGFIDAHGHVTYTNRLQLSANLAPPPVGPVASIPQLIETMKAHQSAYPDAPWIVGFGYDDSLMAERRHPTKQELDQVSTEFPVAVTHVSGHLMSCNSKCLELAGVNANTKDPDGGLFRRMVNTDEPNGVAEETAMRAFSEVIPSPDLSQQKSLLAKTQAEYAAFGVTTVQDGASYGETLDLLEQAAAEELLYLDVVSFPYMVYGVEGLKQHPPTAEYANNYRVGGIKMTLDGSPQGKTAWLSKPYFHPPHGQDKDYAGYATLQEEQVQALVDYAISNNVPMLAHANGDAAADQMIRTVRAANKQFGKADRRPVMIHAQTVREDQIDAMVEEGIVPSYFVAHTFFWGDWHRDSVLGEQRASRISPLRSSSDKGLRYTIHNDTPVVPADMMRLLWTAVNRVTRSGKVLGTEQRATVMEGIKAMTLYAAYQFFEESSKGSLSVGKRADIVVLEENPLTVPSMAIKDIAVLETIKDGKTVFRLGQ
ncbi:MAG: amidohydrolase [Pseudomonadales bacterium]